MRNLRTQAKRLQRKATKQSFALTCIGALILIGAGPIVGGQQGTLIQTIGGDLLVVYGLVQARNKRRPTDKADAKDNSE